MSDPNSNSDSRGWLLQLSDKFNNATGHKSTHYSPQDQEDIAYEQARKARQPKDEEPELVTPEARYGVSMTGKPAGNGLGIAQRRWESSAPGYLSPEEKQQVARAAMQRAAMMSTQTQAVNDAANNTRMGGRFTNAGLMGVDASANANALDRIKAKSMIGLGGSLRLVPGQNGNGFGY